MLYSIGVAINLHSSIPYLRSTVPMYYLWFNLIAPSSRSNSISRQDLTLPNCFSLNLESICFVAITYHRNTSLWTLHLPLANAIQTWIRSTMSSTKFLQCKISFFKSCTACFKSYRAFFKHKYCHQFSIFLTFFSSCFKSTWIFFAKVYIKCNPERWEMSTRVSSELHLFLNFIQLPTTCQSLGCSTNWKCLYGI